MENLKLLEHRLHFLSTHRGERKSADGVEYIVSDDSRYNQAFPSNIKNTKNISKDFKICIPEWVAEDLNLPNRKLHRSITFMTLNSFSSGKKYDTIIRVKNAETIQDIEKFTLIQTKGFYGSSPEYNKKLLWLKDKNLQNFPDPKHHFLTAYYKDTPAASALMIEFNNMIGLNMLATVPEFREKGLSTAIIKFAVDFAKWNNIPVVTLQVDTDSYTHNFYLHRGFKNKFICKEYIHTVNQE